jgi:type I restriction-modification system DNA methylase subunit
MSLFQKSVVNKYLENIDKELLRSKWISYKSYFHDPKIQENIKAIKEEAFQEGFIRELFVNILGYRLNPTPDYNFVLEKKNVDDSRKADGAITIENKVKAVIELKDTKITDLAKVKDQAFGYKVNQPDSCLYVITSNFEKLWFYIDNAIDKEPFDLFTLTEEQFKLLYLCLSFESISNDIPKKVKNESLSEEDIITQKLYKDYSLFKSDLYQNLVHLNPDFEPLELFKKSQKLLDRFLFLFFGEDRHLLPPNSVRLILSDWKDLQERDEEIPLYNRFKKYFEYLNVGYKGKRYHVFAYNGELFKPDGILDSIIIDDDLLYKHTIKLAEYDFASEVDVNILGHIFENSINELDEIKAQLEGHEIDKSKTKRKKDGVFYTPKYITQYIVENTVGKICKEKKEALGIFEVDYFNDNKRQKKTIVELNDKLAEYRKWLLKLTICDPACGSGAFLNQALDFLIAEHRNTDELQAKLFGNTIVFECEKSILENNLFGVDVNEESVEIAKLSLWLRTAKHGRSLSNLSNNIKCGNSLIDDPNVAGDKAFLWRNEFPEVFAKGGFDVVIGNPPYVFARDNFTQDEKDFYVNQYVSAKYQINTYLLFIEKTVKILKTNGLYGLIIPNAWLMVYSGEGLRKYLLESCTLFQIINLEGYSFESANVETVILLAENKSVVRPNSLEIYLNNGNEFYLSHIKNQLDFKNNEGFEFKVFLDDASDNINLKINLNTFPLDDLVEIKAGLQAYEKGKGEPKQSIEDVVNRPYDYDYRFDENTHKYLEGKDVGRYFTNWSGLYLKYGKNLASPRTLSLFEGKKIIVREITGNFPQCLISTYSEELLLYNRSNIGIVEKKDSDISLKYITSLLNSSLMSYYFVKNTAKSVRKLFPKIILNDLRKFPIKKIPIAEQYPFIEKADLMLNLNTKLQEITQKFQRTIQRKFDLEELPKKLQDWYKLSYAEFIKELAKKKVILALAQEAEWEDYFMQESRKALELKDMIDAADKAINNMVYKLYELSEEEIQIVKNS